jgi:sodium/bile acid cotransporter 7
MLSDAQKKEQVYRMYTGYKKDFPNVRDIMPAEAMALSLKDAVVFVDVRKPAEMEISALPGAITREEFMNHPDQYRGKPVVAYCTISYRSGVFARQMAEKGIDIFNLTGGILAWVLEGGRVYNTSGETPRIHVYSEKWNLAPDTYEVVMFSLWEQVFR